MVIYMYLSPSEVSLKPTSTLSHILPSVVMLSVIIAIILHTCGKDSQCTTSALYWNWCLNDPLIFTVHLILYDCTIIVFYLIMKNLERLLSNEVLWKCCKIKNNNFIICIIILSRIKPIVTIILLRLLQHFMHGPVW